MMIKIQLRCLELAIKRLNLARAAGLSDSVVDIAIMKLSQVIDRLKAGEVER